MSGRLVHDRDQHQFLESNRSGQASPERLADAEQIALAVLNQAALFTRILQQQARRMIETTATRSSGEMCTCEPFWFQN
jgi:hypothetical protein